MTTFLDNWETLVTAVALSLGIAATRFLPFILFSKKEKPPRAILYLGGALPQASMAMLLVYCLKDVSVTGAPHGAPEALGVAFTMLMHLWRGNAMLSIAGGTLLYMFLLQRVFV